MPREKRPADYPRLLDYKPTPFMLPESHYDKAKADRAVRFIENLRHTKGKWDGKPFWLLPWQEQIIRDVFGVVDEDGNRQFRTAYVEIGKKNGKSELAAAVALYLLYADNEPSAEVYGAAADRQQASIVFDVAKRMVEKSPALLKRSKIAAATKRIVNYSNAGFYQVLSAEVGTKHGLNVSGLVFDEVHAQPNRKLYDVLTKGSGDARERVQLSGFGSFEVSEREAHVGINPQTGEPVEIHSSRTPKFKAGKALKDLVSGKNKHA